MSGITGRSGRRPKPVATKQLAGNPGGRKLNTDQPDFDLVTNIFCPVWMGEYGKELWDSVAPQLCAQQVMAMTDIQNLEVYCNAYDQFRLAQQEVRDNGVVMAGSSGSPIKNPAATALKEAVSVMATYGGMLGLDPSSRQRLTGGAKKSDGNPYTGLIN